MTDIHYLPIEEGYGDTYNEDNGQDYLQEPQDEGELKINYEEEDPDESQLRLNGIAREILRKVKENVQSMTALDLSGLLFSNTFYREFACHRRHNTALRELYLHNCRLTDNSLRQILGSDYDKTPPKHLKVLSCENNLLKNISCYYLARSFGLVKDKFSRTHAGRKAVSHGPARDRLEKLNLRGNFIDESEGMKFLSYALIQQDMALQVLILAENRIDGHGAAWLGMALRNNNVLRCLDLRGNPVGRDGRHEILLAAETADANLLYAAGTDFVNALPGRRNVCIYVDAGILDEANRKRTFDTLDPRTKQSYPAFLSREAIRTEASLKPPTITGRKALAAMKRTASLGSTGWTPMSIMADRKDGNVYDTSASKMGQTYSRFPRPDREIYTRISEEGVNPALKAAFEKEFCTTVAKSRLRFKVGNDYLLLKEAAGGSASSRSRSPSKSPSKSPRGGMTRSRAPTLPTSTTRSPTSANYNKSPRNTTQQQQAQRHRSVAHSSQRRTRPSTTTSTGGGRMSSPVFGRHQEDENYAGSQQADGGGNARLLATTQSLSASSSSRVGKVRPSLKPNRSHSASPQKRRSQRDNQDADVEDFFSTANSSPPPSAGTAAPSSSTNSRSRTKFQAMTELDRNYSKNSTTGSGYLGISGTRSSQGLGGEVNRYGRIETETLIQHQRRGPLLVGKRIPREPSDSEALDRIFYYGDRYAQGEGF
ncbi:unnamed protein product [Amoebophrya sp. A25]|nr:unnamed protein product [Amoebophrya sp. A25]|eukprot:GSA25T00024453001.1